MKCKIKRNIYKIWYSNNSSFKNNPSNHISKFQISKLKQKEDIKIQSQIIFIRFQEKIQKIAMKNSLCQTNLWKVYIMWTSMISIHKIISLSNLTRLTIHSIYQNEGKEDLYLIMCNRELKHIMIARKNQKK